MAEIKQQIKIAFMHAHTVFCRKVNFAKILRMIIRYNNAIISKATSRIKLEAIYSASGVSNFTFCCWMLCCSCKGVGLRVPCCDCHTGVQTSDALCINLSIGDNFFTPLYDSRSGGFVVPFFCGSGTAFSSRG